MTTVRRLIGVRSGWVLGAALIAHRTASRMHPADEAECAKHLLLEGVPHPFEGRADVRLQAAPVHLRQPEVAREEDGPEILDHGGS